MNKPIISVENLSKAYRLGRKASRTEIDEVVRDVPYFNDMFDRLINQGPTNLSYIVEMLARAFGGYDRIRRLTTRFTANVFEGDFVTASGIVTAVEDGIAVCDVWLDRSDGERAISGTARMSLSA